MEQQQWFPAQPESVRQARRFVGGVLTDRGRDSSVVELLTSELTTNAVLHARSSFTVWIGVQDEVVRVEVINDEPELLLIMKEPSPQHRGGRGLGIIKAFASDWGAESRRDSKVVWFEVDSGAEEASVGA